MLPADSLDRKRSDSHCSGLSPDFSHTVRTLQRLEFGDKRRTLTESNQLNHAFIG
jgi:hypothetical protein